jgi:hypothetical protein
LTITFVTKYNFNYMKLKVNVANKDSITLKKICETEINIIIAKKKLKLLVVEEIKAEIITGTNVFYIFRTKINFETIKIRMINSNNKIQIKCTQKRDRR